MTDVERVQWIVLPITGIFIMPSGRKVEVLTVRETSG